MHRGADLEADLTLGATHELALNQAAILHLVLLGHLSGFLFGGQVDLVRQG